MSDDMKKLIERFLCYSDLFQTEDGVLPGGSNTTTI
jgi:hypothetical protein